MLNLQNGNKIAVYQQLIKDKTVAINKKNSKA
jgi:hypothetical protein